MDYLAEKFYNLLRQDKITQEDLQQFFDGSEPIEFEFRFFNVDETPVYDVTFSPKQLYFEEYKLMHVIALSAWLLYNKDPSLLQQIIDHLPKQEHKISTFTIASEFGVSINQLMGTLIKLHLVKRIGNKYILCQEYEHKGYALTLPDEDYPLWTETGKQFITDTLEDAGFRRPMLYYQETGYYPIPHKGD